MKPLSRVLPISLLCLAAATGAGAAEPDVHATRTTTPIVVDGLLNEAAWQAAEAVTNFKMSDPTEGGVPSQRTDLRVAFDDEAIYFGVRCYDSAPDSILARLSRRDVSVSADRIMVYLDPYHDKRSGYFFGVNAAGTLFDGTLSNDGNDDDSWDGVWQGRVHRDEQGYAVEMRIPYSQLRFQKSNGAHWGINANRSIPRRNENIFLVYTPKKESGFVSRFPDLVGLEGIRGGHAIEVIPYATTQAEYLRHAPLDPFNDGSRYLPNGGADVRTGLGQNLTLNATINPDFGQVEVDPAVLNLGDGESYFGEKRPFFVEGSSNFRFGNEGANSYWNFNWPEPTFFYSRRIGRTPQGALPPPPVDHVAPRDTVRFADIPLGTTILGAAKLTGKIAPTWNFGTLHAVTGREMADLQIPGLRSEYEVEPLTYYGAARTQKEFKNRQQGLGFMTTLAARSFDNPALRDQLNARARMTGVDGWVFLDKKQLWVISGYSAMSLIQGTPARLVAVQEGSGHYLQRPDANNLGVNTTATSLRGYVARLWLNKQKGNVILNSGLGFVTPRFDVNDMGFQWNSDVINGHVATGYKWTEPTKVRRYQDVSTAVFASYDFDGNPIWGGWFAQGSTEFNNRYSWNYETAYNPQTRSNRRTRGGPLMLNKPGYEFSNYFDTDGNKKLFYFINFYSYTQPDAGSYNWNVGPGFEWKPSSNLLVRFGPYYERVHETAQYVTTAPDPSATATYGSRYVFATLDQHTVIGEVRLNWAFTPNLSLQTYLQPYISTGAYTDYKSLARPISYEFDPYAYVGNRDFNFASLRGNAIVRWEYMPGSTMFFVWTHQRDGYENVGTFHLDHSFDQLIDTNADNRFMVKVTYYLAR